MSTLLAKEFAPSGTVIPMGTLSAASSGSDVIDLQKHDTPSGLYDKIAIQSVVALSTSTKVALRVEGNIDNSDDWANLDDSGVDTEISEDGTTIFTFDNLEQEIRYVRVYFASETGGTGASIVNSARVN